MEHATHPRFFNRLRAKLSLRPKDKSGRSRSAGLTASVRSTDTADDDSSQGGRRSQEPERYQLFDNSWADDWSDDDDDDPKFASIASDRVPKAGKIAARKCLAWQLKFRAPSLPSEPESTPSDCDSSSSPHDPLDCEAGNISMSTIEEEDDGSSSEDQRTYSSAKSTTEPADKSAVDSTASACMPSNSRVVAGRKQVRIPPQKTYYCVICLENKASASFPLGKLVRECRHTSRSCVACFSQSITSQLTAKFFKELTCPLCPALLDYETVSKFATDETFQKYDSIATRECMTSLPNWWECPYPDCSYGGVHDTADKQSIIICSACEKRACYACKSPWHKGLTCKEFKKRKAADKEKEKRAAMNERLNVESEKTIERVTKACPNAFCQVRIQKNKGCQHMTCRSNPFTEQYYYTGYCSLNDSAGSKCAHQFCWDCLASWVEISKEGNTAHARSCPWHTNNLR